MLPMWFIILIILGYLFCGYVGWQFGKAVLESKRLASAVFGDEQLKELFKYLFEEGDKGISSEEIGELLGEKLETDKIIPRMISLGIPSSVVVLKNERLRLVKGWRPFVKERLLKGWEIKTKL